MTDDNIELTRRKILGSVGAVGAAGAAAGLGTSALFSDDESFENNSITAGTLDMTVDASIPADGINDAWAGAVGFDDYDPDTADGEAGMGVTLGDMKPGDWVLLCYDITVNTNPACLSLATENTANDENSVTEPEAGDDPNNNTVDPDGDIDGEGELAQNLAVTVYDDLDPAALDGTLAGAESALSNELLGGVTLADVWSTFGGGGAIAADTRNFDFYLLLELPTETGNEVQSDSVEWDFVFDAVQSRNNECDTPVWEDDGPSCDCPEENFTAGSTDDAFTNLLSVGPDPDSGFPEIDARLRVDTTDGNAGDLTASNFAINEDGCGQTIDGVDFESGGAVDIVVVFDDTGSLSGEISTLKSEVDTLTSDIESADIDARYALVSFKDEVELDQDFTDAPTFQGAVDNLSASGGGDTPEDNIDALAVGTGNAPTEGGASLSSFRSGAQRIVIDITDVGAYDSTDSGFDGTARFTQAEIETFLNDGNFTFYAVAPESIFTSGIVSKRDIANNVDNGTWININDADFDVILNDIVSEITEPAYVISYTTACPDEDGTDRTVDVEVDDPDEGMLYEQGSYTAPGGGT